MTERRYPSEANSIISQCTVSMLDMNHDQYNAYAVRVTRTGHEKWIVQSHYGQKTWRSTDASQISYLRRGNYAWVDAYTFTFTEALNLAWKVAAIVTINGRTAYHVLEQEGDSTDDTDTPDPDVVPPAPGTGPDAVDRDPATSTACPYCECSYRCQYPQVRKR